MSNELTPLHSLQITNQCVVICELDAWADHESPAWRMFTGSQDDIGRELARLLDERG